MSISFRSKFCPVDFNLDLAACATFRPSMTSDARFRPVFKASRTNVLAPLCNKGTADLNRLPKILPSLFQRSENVLVPEDSTAGDQKLWSPYLRLFFLPVRFSTVVPERLPPSSGRPVGNTRTENFLPWLRLLRDLRAGILLA